VLPNQFVLVRTGIPELTPGNYNLPRLYIDWQYSKKI